MLPNINFTFKVHLAKSASVLRAGVPSPDWEDACLIGYFPVPVPQDVGRSFGLPLTGEDALFVPHDTSDG